MKKFIISKAFSLAILFIVLFALGGCIASFYADAVLYPPRQPIVKTPLDYGMDYDSIEFKSPDNINLKGWLIKGKLNKTVIISHPMSFTKYGFSAKDQNVFMSLYDKDVEFIRTAKALNNAGYSVLMFDFRNHGESDKGNNGITGVGLNEYPDMVGAVNYIRGREDIKSDPIGFMSFCMGANSSIIAMSKARDELINKNIKCMIAVQPISTEVFVRAFGKDKGVDPNLLKETEKICIERGGYAFSAMSPLLYAKDIFVPTLYVQAKSDPWTELDYVMDTYKATPEPKELLLLEGKMHRFDTYNYFGEHPEKMLQFFSKYL